MHNWYRRCFTADFKERNSNCNKALHYHDRKNFVETTRINIKIISKQENIFFDIINISIFVASKKLVWLFVFKVFPVMKSSKNKVSKGIFKI